MAITTALQRQPTSLDFANGTQFRFNILRLPNVEYFVTGVNLPGISFSGEANINTRYKSISMMGDVLDYSDLEITFAVQENYANYKEIHDWMTGIGFPKDNDQFGNAVTEYADLTPGSNPSTTDANRAGTGKTPVNPSSLFSDASLTLLTNKNNPTLKVSFKNIHPINLSSLAFNTQITDTEPLTATATFRYHLYEFETL